MDFSQKLIGWYEKHKRDLPWRATKDPYKIWLSEIILQQTRVKQGLPYYQKFVEAYPTVQDLANAEEKEVLRLWQGLGYYSRARNMHTTAQFISQNLQGQFPQKYADILKLKGVGKYTAAAIASFAFEEKVAVVDGNVYRVLARAFGIDTDIASTQGQKEFAQLAQELMPEQKISIYNQAIMEFGAIQCTPKNPNCLFCPLTETCEARLKNKQSQLPVKIKKLKIKERYFHYLVLDFDGKLLMKEREGKGIWQGLYDFPNIEDTKLLGFETLMTKADSFKENSQDFFSIENITEPYKHILTHQRLYVRFFHLKLHNENFMQDFLKNYGGNFYNFANIQELPKPILIDNYLNEYFF